MMTSRWVEIRQERKEVAKFQNIVCKLFDSTANDLERLSETIEKSGLPVAAAQRSVQKEVQSKCLYMCDQCANFLKLIIY